jgi:hypothetical protein
MRRAGGEEDAVVYMLSLLVLAFRAARPSRMGARRHRAPLSLLKPGPIACHIFGHRLNKTQPLDELAELPEEFLPLWT